MTFLVGILLAILAWLNRKVGGTFLYPPAIFAAVWAALLLLLAASGATFNPLSYEVLAFYLGAAVAFSIGGLLGLSIYSRKQHAGASPLSVRQKSRIRKILDLGLIAVMVSVPSTGSTFWISHGVRNPNSFGGRSGTNLLKMTFLHSASLITP